MTFECEIVADGMRIVEPGGNSMTRPHSQRIRWPPFLGSKSPNAVTAHMPKGRLEKSVCLKQTVRGPKLYVVAANTLVGKIRLSEGHVRVQGVESVSIVRVELWCPVG
jgi:hypothetical protein